MLPVRWRGSRARDAWIVGDEAQDVGTYTRRQIIFQKQLNRVERWRMGTNVKVETLLMNVEVVKGRYLTVHDEEGILGDKSPMVLEQVPG
jgi:hypothetical protein